MRLKEDTSGIIIVITALVISAIVLVVVFAVSVNEWIHEKSVVRTAADAASNDAAMTLCSTRSCWNQSLINGLLAIRRFPVAGVSSQATFQAALDAVVDNLRAQVNAGTSFISGPDGTSQWTIDGVVIQIQRGRWWPKGVMGLDGTGNTVRIIPATVDDASLIPAENIFQNVAGRTTEPRFEPFDRYDGVNWQLQAGHQGTPNYIAANAVRVTIRVPDFRSALQWTSIPTTSFNAETISARNKETPQLRFCAAPFAIPVCSLLNNSGDYRPKEACQFDRFFTDEKRYCTDSELSDGTCNVLPGSWYAPITDTYCDNTKSWYSEAKCECLTATRNDYNRNSGYPPLWVQGLKTQVPPEPWDYGRTVAPCSQEYGQNSQECSFFPWAKLDSVSDHFGVVGNPQNYENYNMDPLAESTYQWIFNTLCIEASYVNSSTYDLNKVYATNMMNLGERFFIKPGGLQDPETDSRLWKVIWGGILQENYKDNPKWYDPLNTRFGPEGFQELGFPWFMGRADDARGYPYGRTKTFLDQLISYRDPYLPIDMGYIKPYKNFGELDSATGLPKQAIEPYECNKLEVPQFGTCNSHRTWYNNMCQRKDRWFVQTSTPTNSITLSGQGYMQGYANEGYPWEWAFTDSESGMWSCDELPPYMPCNIAGNPGYPEGGESAPPSWHKRLYDHLAWQTKIWQPKIPIIADMSANAQPCQGIGGSVAPDPVVDPTHDWRIVGFIRANIFDNDIGKPPPKPPGPSWESNPVSGGAEPKTCNYESADVDGNGEPDRQPWGFNPGYRPPPPGDPSGAPANRGAERNCNMVRGRVACDPGLIAGDYSGLGSEPKTPPSIVYAR